MGINIIAELGVNWGTIKNACEMIRFSKECGCNYVKFQVFNEDTIVDSPIREKLEPLILSESDIETLRNCADEHKIGFILTPMYMDAVDLAAKYADLIKIRYADHENKSLIDKALDTGKMLLMSVPRRPLGPMLYHIRVRYMYCISRYPPEPEDLDLDRAVTFHGFSSHFPHTVFDLAYAVDRTYHECYIEKHVMLKFSKPIDHAVSITFERLRSFIEDLKLIERLKRTRLE